MAKNSFVAEVTFNDSEKNILSNSSKILVQLLPSCLDLLLKNIEEYD